jgi:hypothetical protein
MNIDRFKPTQKIRLVSGPVHLHTTVGKVRNGIGDSCMFNAATQKAVDALEYTRSGAIQRNKRPIGISGIWEGVPVQVDVMA